MACRESRLRYTLFQEKPAAVRAMACRESRLRYTARRRVCAAFFAMACRESRLRYTHFMLLVRRHRLWPVESPGFDTLPGPSGSLGSGYGLSRVPASIHFLTDASHLHCRYGLSRVPASIHFDPHLWSRCSAMACRESRLRYTERHGRQQKLKAMACRESRLRYTLSRRRCPLGLAMACRESRLRYTIGADFSPAHCAMACRESRLRYTVSRFSRPLTPLWPVESPGFDTLVRFLWFVRHVLWPVESPGFDTLEFTMKLWEIRYGLSCVFQRSRSLIPI